MATASAGSRDRSGQLVAGRFRILRLLGRGGVASVWLALDNLLGRPVALKELPPRESSGGGCSGALREARAAATVSHPGVVQVYGLVVDDHREWIVMEALGGTTLRHMLRETGSLAPDRVAAIGVLLLEALRSLHRVNIVHGDVKPSNVQVVEAGRPVLTDFGLASRASGVADETSPFVAGSPPYMAPEVILRGVRDAASDLFSLGATLYEAAMGTRPFHGATPVETAHAVLSSEPATPLRGHELGRVIDGLLVKDPCRRLGARDAHRWLQEIQAELERGR